MAPGPVWWYEVPIKIQHLLQTGLTKLTKVGRRKTFLIGKQQLAKWVGYITLVELEQYPGSCLILTILTNFIMKKRTIWLTCNLLWTSSKNLQKPKNYPISIKVYVAGGGALPFSPSSQNYTHIWENIHVHKGAVVIILVWEQNCLWPKIKLITEFGLVKRNGISRFLVAAKVCEQLVLLPWNCWFSRANKATSFDFGITQLFR